MIEECDAPETTLAIDSAVYKRAEQQARDYFQQLSALSAQPDYLKQLYQDYQEHARQEGAALRSLPDIPHDTWSFFDKLAANQQLERYLEQALRYIFIRDLGRRLDERKTQTQIRRAVRSIKRWLVNRSKTPTDVSLQFTQQVQPYGLELTFLWLNSKLRQIRKHLPIEIGADEAMRKLIKIIAGVVLHYMVSRPSSLGRDERRQGLDNAIRLGYCYGITYPLIDDLQDAPSVLNAQERELFYQAVKQSLLSTIPAPCPKFSSAHQQQMGFIYGELSQAFKEIKSRLPVAQHRQFFAQAYVFFEAQEQDRLHRPNQPIAEAEDLYVPVILKSAGCRLIARSLADEHDDQGLDLRTFCFGIYNQFNDDIKDLDEDMASGNVTPYTYHLILGKKHPLGVVPYRLYWAVVHYLIYHVYAGHQQTRQLLLERSLNAIRSMRQRIGSERYHQIRPLLLSSGDRAFDSLIETLVDSKPAGQWFDKLMSQQISDTLRQQNQREAHFRERYDAIRHHISPALKLSQHHRLSSRNLVDASNYSIASGGKRFRSVLAYIVGVESFGLSDAQCLPVVQMLEYMHTASLIFDDKPSQDNAPMRRGRPSLHHHCQSEATAELAAINLMMKAVECLTTIEGLPSPQVIAAIGYASNTTQAISEGQQLDLTSCITTSQQQLTEICRLKTGLAIEAALVIPALLSGQSSKKIQQLQSFAEHMGLAYQIKDDLLDATSDAIALGKPIQQDRAQQKASFVTCLGQEAAATELFKHHQAATKLLSIFGPSAEFLQFLIDYVVFRED
tara:strand:- start:2798 stop:5158 length:2361 start_codon:yes stop_codon:yes gene_type:complete